jgi:tetratricopeptide (TPR) repeat protein
VSDRLTISEDAARRRAIVKSPPIAQDYSEAIRIDPKLAIGYSNRGNMYNPKGDLDRAIDDYNRWRIGTYLI